jgi:predicted helicase
MLAQHMITKPVFNALFSDYNFADNNAISKSMQGVLDILDEHHIDNEAHKLEKFYESVKRKADGITSPQAKQKIVIELYDKFFRNAFPRMTERLGIVYTPVECVDFIIHSVNDILKQEFNQELGDKNTHIIDPFTGTGTFITRLMQSGLLSKEQLEYKYNLREKSVNGEKIFTTELHANEIVLLAYYIASINIESVYHAIVGGNYKPFEGICLTDTFQLNEKSEDLITPQLADNNHRRKIQKKIPIRVFIGNPPYSAGQTSGNDNNQNVKYPKLDKSLENTYVKESIAGLSKGVYDSYIRGIRWASDRIDKYGVIGFITNAGWIDSNSADGMRKCLKDEFSSIYVFHLRGNARTSGELRRKEKDNVFGQGTRTPIAITIFVKNPEAKEHGKIYFHDIGDYLTQDEKLAKIEELKSLTNITKLKLWQDIIPDKHNDWLNQRDDSFYNYISLGDKKSKSEVTIFENFTLGLATNRDAWVYNYSKSRLTKNVANMIDFYNSELERYKNSEEIKKQPNKLADAEKYVANFVNNDAKKIAWTVNVRAMFSKLVLATMEQNNFISALYRPFTKVNCYFNQDWNERTLQLPKIFPENGINNLVIGTASIGAKSFSVLISNVIQDLHTLESACQCFPMYLYEPIADKPNQALELDFADNAPSDVVTAPSGKQYKRKSAITDARLKHFTDFYNDTSITKEDLFYYIYGLLHSEQYKTKYADNLTKALPRIPCVKSIADFKAFEQSGRKLAKLHLDYETVEMYPVTYKKDISNLTSEDYHVIKMKFASKTDKSKIIYNCKITLENIPLEAYEYVVNGKSAIEWVMERQSVSTHKDSGIVNDANDWDIETMNNSRYPLELLQRVITVSLETVEIVNNLPQLKI